VILYLLKVALYDLFSRRRLSRKKKAHSKSALDGVIKDMSVFGRNVMSN
jgi:hypothetical protein